MIPHSRPVFDASFSKAMQDVLATGQTAASKQVKCLEEQLQKRLRHADAVAVDSGSSALMLAIRALALQSPKQGFKRVGIPAYACASLLFAVRAAGCEAVCMDCGDDLRLHRDKALALAESLDAVVLVHPFGMFEPLVNETWPCPVIEDIAQAAGSVWQGQALGSFADVSIVSFYATKPWGGAYGGMVLGDEALCEQVRLMCDTDQACFEQAYVGHHQLSDVHATLVLCRLQRAEEEQQQRRKQMQWLNEHLPADLLRSIEKRDIGSAYRYIIRVQGEADAYIAKLHQHGIAAAKPVQKPLHDAMSTPCDGAMQAWQDCVSLPLLANMSELELQYYERGLTACFAS